MSASPNLAIPHVVSNQNNKEVTINEAVDALDRAFNDAVDVDCSAGDTTIAAADFTANAFLRLIGTPGAAFNLAVPARKRLFVVANEAGQAATVTTGAGATVVVAPGERAVLYGDGTGMLQAAEAAGTRPIDIGFFFGGTPAASQTVKFIATRALHAAGRSRGQPGPCRHRRHRSGRL